MLNKKEEEQQLHFKVGDPVTGLYLSDLKEDINHKLLNRKEKVLDIKSDGNGYFFITTDFTKEKEEEIKEKNKEKKDEDNKINLAWYINAKNNEVNIIKKIKSVDLSTIDATMEGDDIVFDNIDIPLKLFKSLNGFITLLETKGMSDIIDIEKEVTITISGREFTPSIIKNILE